VGPNPTDRGKMGTKKSVLADGEGGPLGLVIAGANVLERRMLRATIEAIVVERPEPTEEHPQNLSLDGGYQNPTGRKAATDAKYIPHIHSSSEVVLPGDRKPGYKPRRWVVERTLAWLSKCRGILVRYDKKDTNYLGLIQFACALYWYRRLDRLGQCDANQSPT
jgi:putative transposase